MAPDSPKQRNLNAKIYPLNLDHIPEFLYNKCETELKETPENKLNGLAEIRELLADDPITGGISFEEDYIVQYLRHAKYDVKRAFSRLKNCVSLKTNHSYLFESIPDEFYSTKSSTKFLVVLPKRCPEGCPIVRCQLGKWDPDELDILDLKRIIVITFLQLIRDPMAQVSGVKILYDFEGTELKHLRYITPRNIYLLFHGGFQCLPIRYTEAHILNKTLVFGTAWKIIKIFLSKKIKDRIFVHSNMETLLDFLPVSVLPTQYGGELTDTDDNSWIRKANQYQEKYSVKGQPNLF